MAHLQTQRWQNSSYRYVWYRHLKVWWEIPLPVQIFHFFIICVFSAGCNWSWYTWEQGLWGQHGAHLGPTGPRWVPCWSHEPCYLGYDTMYTQVQHPMHPGRHLFPSSDCDTCTCRTYWPLRWCNASPRTYALQSDIEDIQVIDIRHLSPMDSLHQSPMYEAFMFPFFWTTWWTSVVLMVILAAITLMWPHCKVNAAVLSLN